MYVATPLLRGARKQARPHTSSLTNVIATGERQTTAESTVTIRDYALTPNISPEITID